jgi:hypothetical protein
MSAMPRSVAVAMTVVVAGCAQLAGIDETSGDDRQVNSLTLQRVSIGATVVRAPLDLTGLEASFLLPDATTGEVARLPGQTSPGQPGTWSRDLATAVPVELTLPDEPTPIPTGFAFPSVALTVAYPVLEHPGRMPAPASATVEISAPLDAVVTIGDSFSAYTVGSWTSRGLPAVVGVAQLTVAPYLFSSATSLSGRATHDLLTTQDAFLVLRHAGTRLTGVAEAPPFDQTGSDSLTLPAMTAVAADQTLDLKIQPQTLAQRYSAVRPAVATLAMGWSVVAAPGAAFASNAGPVLQSGAPLPTDTGISASYGNPFAARPAHPWRSLVTFATSSSRVFTPTAAGRMLPATLYAGLNQFVEPSPGLDLAMPVGLPVLITLGTTQLTADGVMVARPAGYVEVSYIVDNDKATIYSLQLFELIATPGGVALDRKLVFAAHSAKPTFQLRPELFEVGSVYTLRAICQAGGFPQVAAGDLSVRELPLAQGYLDSAVFTVTP